MDCVADSASRQHQAPSSSLRGSPRGACTEGWGPCGRDGTERVGGIRHSGHPGLSFSRSGPQDVSTRGLFSTRAQETRVGAVRQGRAGGSVSKALQSPPWGSGPTGRQHRTWLRPAPRPRRGGSGVSLSSFSPPAVAGRARAPWLFDPAPHTAHWPERAE